MTSRFRPHGLVLAGALSLAACGGASPAIEAATSPPAKPAVSAPSSLGPAAPQPERSSATAQSGDAGGQALAAYQAGAYDQAVTAAALAAATAPGERAGAMLFGRALLAADRGTEAERVFSGVLADHPEDLGALNGLGVAQALQGRFAAAVATLERARSRAPDELAVASNLALALFLGGREEEAFALLDRLMARPATPPRVAVLKAVLGAVAKGTAAERPAAPDPLLRRVIALRQR